MTYRYLVWRYLMANPDRKLVHIAEATGLDCDTVKRTLNGLRADGLADNITHGHPSARNQGVYRIRAGVVIEPEWPRRNQYYGRPRAEPPLSPPPNVPPTPPPLDWAHVLPR